MKDSRKAAFGTYEGSRIKDSVNMGFYVFLRVLIFLPIWLKWGLTVNMGSYSDFP